MQFLESLKEIDFSKKNSKEFEDFLLFILEKEGEVKRQVWVDNRGDGRRGRIDFVLWLPNQKIIAIEVDRKTARKKSIFKIKRFKPNEGYIITKDPFSYKKIC